MRRGFVLPELLIFALLVLILSVWLLPIALQERQRENEEHAIRYLHMIAAGEQWWQQERGAYVPLRQLAEQVPAAEDGIIDLRTPALGFQPPMVFGEDGIAHRAGYRYQGGVGRDGRLVGCWAWPNLRTYSGTDTYWVDYQSGQVFRTELAASWTDTPGSGAPSQEQLAEPVSAF